MTTVEGPFAADPWPRAEVMMADAACRRCRYNLRGLPFDGRCPECGTPVAYSTRGDFLCFSEPAWAATLQRGTLLLLIGLLVLIAGAVVGSAERAPGHRLGMIGAVVGFAGHLFYVAGGWLLTTPDPGGLCEDQYGTSQRLIRFAVVVGLADKIVGFARQTQAFPPAAYLAITLLGSAATLVSLVGLFATLTYLSKLARRIPDDALADRARTVMWGIGVPYGVIAVGTIVTVLMMLGSGQPRARGGRSPALLAFGCVGGLSALVLLVFGVIYLVLLGRLARRFGEQAAIARATWAGATAGNT
jgi:hypothetical protein